MAGELAQPEPGRVFIKNERTGEIGSVSTADLRNVPEGWRPETEQEFAKRQQKKEFTSVTEKTKTLAMGAVKGATMGLATPALTETGIIDAERQKLREEFNPMESMAGEVGGSLLGLGKVGAGAKGARALAARGVNTMSAPARATLATGAAAEKAAGAGLRRLGLTGESIGRRMALRGGELAAGGAAEGAMFGAGEALHEAALSGGDYDGLAEKLWAGAKEGAKFGLAAGAGIGGTLGLAGGLGRKIIKRAPEDPRAWLKGVAEDSAVQAIDPSKKALRDLSMGGKRVERIKSTGRRLLDEDIVAAGRSQEDMLARAEQVVNSKGGTIGSILEKLDKKLPPVGVGKMFDQIDEVIGHRAGSMSQKQRDVATALTRELAPLAEEIVTGAVGYKKLHEFRRQLDTTIKWGKTEGSALNDDLQKIRGIVEESIEDAVSAASASGERGLVNAYSEAKKSYAAARWAEQQLSDNLLRGQVNRSISLTDTISGGAGSMIGAAGNVAAGGSALAGLGMGTLVGLGTSLAHKTIREKGRSVLAELADRASKVDFDIDKSVRRFFKGAGDTRRAALGIGVENEVDAALAKKGRETTQDAFRRVADSVKNAQPPGTMVLDTEAPQTAQAARVMATKVQSFLKSKLPVVDRPENPLYDVPEPSPEEIASFARSYKAATDPMSVLQSLNNRTLTSEEVEAIKTLYPRIYQRVQEQVFDRLVEGRESVTYADRIHLGVLLDIPTDPSLEQESLAMAQQLLNAPNQLAQPAATRTPPAKPIADEFETAAQQIESQEFAI